MTIPHPAPPGEHPGIPEIDGSDVCSPQPDMNGIPLGDIPAVYTEEQQVSSPAVLQWPFSSGRPQGPDGTDWEPAPTSDVLAESRTGFATTDLPPFQEERGHSPLVGPDGAGPVERIFTVLQSDMKDS